ncbi:MAG: GntR family transcriptional regulator [Planctomycetota bacterium]
MEHTGAVQQGRQEASTCLKRHSLRGQVRLAIIDLVFSGELSAGERINETKLARRLGVSQTPVREALLSLEGQSFLPRSRHSCGAEIPERGVCQNRVGTRAGNRS